MVDLEKNILDYLIYVKVQVKYRHSVKIVLHLI